MHKISGLRSVAFLGDYLPRKCGIATFTTDLRRAVAGEFPALKCLVVPVNDAEAGYDYPPEVRFELAEQDLPSRSGRAFCPPALRADPAGIERPA